MAIVEQPQFSQRFLTDVIGWDVENWSQALSFWQSRLPVEWSACHALELGCGGIASLSLWLATRARSVICSGYEDIPQHIKLTHQQYGVADRIAYEKIDARSIPYQAAFDVITFKSMLGGIVLKTGPLAIAKQVLEEVHHALKPGGSLLLVENLHATSLHEFARRTAGNGRNWRYFTVDEIKDLCSHFRTFQYVTFGVLGCWGRTEAQRTILARTDKALLEKIVPASWHYIIAAVATK